MKRYEITFLVSDDSDEEVVRSAIEGLISNNGGNLLNYRIDPARRELGDEIDNKKVAKLASIDFEITSDKAIVIKDGAKMIDGVMRSLLVIKKKPSPVKSRIAPEQKPSEKVEIEEIDKKIEEILNE